MERFRNELKYLISDQEMRLIKDRLERVMKLDGHADHGTYMISSLYFDDYDDSCFYDVAAGVDSRKKYRLRYYDQNTERISLESKYKRNNLVQKRITLLDKKEAKDLVSGKYLRNTVEDELKKELSFGIMAAGLHPVMIVEYERIPYVYEPGNVRVTFDFNLRSSSDLGNFLEEYENRRSILPENTQILEVKYDGFLPTVIYDCINVGNLQQLSVSKYCLCRKYKI